MAGQPTSDFLQIADKLKQHNVSHEHIQLFMAYLKDNGMSYDEIMTDTTNASKSSLYQFFSNQLKNESLFHILVQILKPHKKKSKSSTMDAKYSKFATFYSQRPTVDEVLKRNIIHQDFLFHDVEEAINLKKERYNAITQSLNEKLKQNKRRSVTDLCDDDENETDSTIFIRVYINKNYEKRENFDISQDIWKLAQLERDRIEMERLREDIPHAFRKAKIFKHLFNNKQYEMKFYSYNTQKADIEIDDDDDLQTELIAVSTLCDDPDSDEADIMNENKYFKLRAVFSRTMLEETSANDEIKGLKMEREALEKAFDQYIDPDENGDVDIEEWFVGMQKLNVELNETQQKAVYNVMDKDGSGYIEKNDFVLFCMATFASEQLQALQATTLQSVGVQNLHDRTHSQDWNDYNMQHLEREMAGAMNDMMTTEVNQSKEISSDMMCASFTDDLMCNFEVMNTCTRSVMCCSGDIEYDTKIGLSIGGAKDINHFRNCIENTQMPSIDSITYNGLLNEYYFDTQTRKHVEQKMDLDDASMLFYPTYCCAKVQKEDDGNRSSTSVSKSWQCEKCTLQNVADARLCKACLNPRPELEEDKHEREYYMSVGLNSNIKQNEFKRKHLNLVILWDKSGSMQSTFNDDESANYVDVNTNAKWKQTLTVNDKVIVKDRAEWYEAQVINVNKEYIGWKPWDELQIHYVGWDKKYDEWIGINSDRLAPFRKINNKMNCSKSAIKSILKQLTPKDRLGIITFNGEADIVQKLQFVNDIHKNELQQRINDVEAGGSTDFEKGYQTTVQMYLELFADNEYILNSSHDDYDNRVIVLTDAQPNTGSLDSNSLLKMIESYAENDNEIMDEFERNRIYTTFIGIGLDFNTSLIERISNTRGCNYYSVKSTKEFDDKMKEEFDHMVTPLVFNVCLKLKSEGNSCTIDVVYGSDDNKAADIIANGEISRINTLFPSKKRTKEEGGATKGGIQLIKLKKHNDVLSDDIDVRIEVTFEDRNGKKYENIQNVLFNPPKESLNIDNDMIEMDDNECEQMNVNFYDNIGIRKAILLCNYVEIMRKWIESDADQSCNSRHILKMK